MALIKRADADRMARQALVLDLGDLVAEGERIRTTAQKDAERIRTEGRAERDRLIADARARGHAEGAAKGHAEGYQKGLEEGAAKALAQRTPQIEQTVKAWTEALDAFASEREALLEETRSCVLQLAAMLAMRIVKREVSMDPTLVERQLAEAIAVVSRPSKLRVSVHPDDEARARDVLPGLVARFGNVEHAELLIDAAVGRGGCVVRTSGGGEIDATVASQLDRMIEVLLPGAGEAS